MASISDILSFLKRPKGQDSGPTTSETVGSDGPIAAETALAQIDVERAATSQAIEMATQRRRQLLLKAGTDAEITKLDRDLDVLRLKLERLDEAEPLVLQELRSLQVDDRRSRLEEICESYSRAITTFGDVMRVAVTVRDHLIEIRNHAVTNGFEVDLEYMELPDPFPRNFEAIMRFEMGAKERIRHALVRPPKPELFPIVMTEAAGIYNVGEVCGFPAETAWRWVRAGVAKWAPGTRIPPAPPEPEIIAKLTPDQAKSGAMP